MKRKAIQAFTLVEVALALAITSFGIVAVLGLLPGGLTAARNAADSTITATIVQDMFSTLRQQSFTNTTLWGMNYSLANAGSATASYFDQAGNQTNASGPSSYYQITVTNLRVSTSMTMVKAMVVWPAQSATPMNTNIYTTTIANYR